MQIFKDKRRVLGLTVAKKFKNGHKRHGSFRVYLENMILEKVKSTQPRAGAWADPEQTVQGTVGSYLYAGEE